MAPVSLTCCESTLPLTLSLSDFGNLFCPWARQRRAPQYDFFLALFFLAISLRRRPMAVGRSRRELAGDPHQPAVGQFVLAIFAAARGDRTRPPAPLSNGVNGDSTRLERAPLLRWWCR